MLFRRILENPILVAVGASLIVVLGVLSVIRVPVQLIPDLDVRAVTVVTRWPGATPQDVEREILVEQEEYLSNIAGIDRMISRASMGRAEIELEFPYGTDIDDVLVRVNNALTQVPSYPENVDEPRIIANSYSDNSFVFFGIFPLPGNDGDINTFYDEIDDQVRVQIARVPGVSEADLRGGVERQMRIYVDPGAARRSSHLHRSGAQRDPRTQPGRLGRRSGRGQETLCDAYHRSLPDRRGDQRSGDRATR